MRNLICSAFFSMFSISGFFAVEFIGNFHSVIMALSKLTSNVLLGTVFKSVGPEMKQFFMYCSTRTYLLGGVALDTLFTSPVPYL